VSLAGDAEPRTCSESAGMRFVTRDELADLTFWPAQLPIRAALLADGVEPIVS